MFYEFNDNLVYISPGSFQQNKLVAKKIRKYTSNLLTGSSPTQITCIGGEAYLIGITSNLQVNNYTNSGGIYSDANYNNTFYRKIITNNLVNYNDLDLVLEKNDTCLINLANLNNNLLKIVNNNDYKEIIIVSCHHLDFWKKTKLLTNYQLITRTRFITTCNFITVNVLKRIEFVSLGYNCAISYHLQQLNLKKFSYPFDYCRVSINQLNTVLMKNFKNFQDLLIVKYSDNHKVFGHVSENEIGSFILKNVYGITFAHELTTIENLYDFKCKLKRRIDRFISLKNIYPVFIILNPDDPTQLDILRNNLYKLFGKNYKLKVVHAEWGDDWKYSHVDWKGLFEK